MDVTAFIRELLFGHDCVIVPGFGGFIGNYTPARIDKSTGTFYPPVKQISFNRNLNHNDGLLVGRISGSSEINYGDARTIVDEFVADVKRKLTIGEKVVFDKIGTFLNNHEGNVQFEPDRNTNYLLDSYGLETFHRQPLEGYDVRKRIIRKKDQLPAISLPVRKILWRAAIIIPLLTLLVAVPLKTDLFKSKVETTSMNPLVTAEFENNKKAVDESAAKDQQAMEGIKSDSSALTIIPEVKTPVTVVINPYTVITGSFKSKVNADQQVNVLKNEGFIPEIITTENGFYRVCAIECNDLPTAVSKKDSISKKFPGCWVSRKK